MTTISRICRHCGKDTPFDQLAKNKNCRDGVDACCRPCVRAKVKKWQQEHPEKPRAYKQKYKVVHADEVKQQNVAYNQRHKEKHAKRRQHIYARDRQRELETAKTYRRSPKGKLIQTAAHARRRARKLNAEGHYTDNDVKQQYTAQHGKCYWCNKKVGNRYHVDHVIPLSRGGSNWPSNIVIACPTCNFSKNDKLPHEWDGSGGRML